MNWLTLALISYFLNAIVSVVDKSLLTNKAKNALVYAFYVGVLNSLAFVLWPFDFDFLSLKITLLALFSGAAFFAAIFFFYSALLRASVSRVVPVVGAISSVTVLFLSFLFLDERLPAFWLFAFALFVFGGLLLTLGKGRVFSAYSFAAAVFFAASFFTAKLVYLETSFLNGFIWIRTGTLLLAFFILFLPSFRHSLRHSPLKISNKLFLFFASNKVLSAGAFILLNYAIMLGPVSMVNALQGAQYAFIFLLALILSHSHPYIIKESFSKKVFIQKLFGIILVSFGIFILFIPVSAEVVHKYNFGVTYSKLMAEDFGLDWQEAYKALLEDLGFKKIRIPVYWEEVEPREGAFDFSSVDWMLEEAKKYDAEIILAVGYKLPRWPECHAPHWVQEFSISNSQFPKEKLLNYIESTIKRYDNNSIVWAWQIENEPFLNFGICPQYEPKFVDEEIKLVRSLSDKPIIITDGGEFGDWFRAYKRADIFGSTLYRHIASRFIGEWTYPIPPWFFRLKQGMVEIFYGLPAGRQEKKPMFVAELQAEPWIDGVVKDSSLEKQYSSFGPERFKELMEYIKGTGFDTFYFWGGEWWYWLKKNGHPEMWEAVRSVVK
ncbi:beta-galactosidase [Patescibacteria group bacterium]|nr:beta-galactosidase [Patescibacteria group bacterium]